MDIMIVGECLFQNSKYKVRAFPSADQQVRDGILRQAQINPKDCYITNVFNRPLPGNNIKSLCTSEKKYAIPGYRMIAQKTYLRAEHAAELRLLYLSIALQQPNVIIALGNVPLWALCKKAGIKKYRGSPLLTFDLKDEFAKIPELHDYKGRTTFKVVPTWAINSIFKQWEIRAIALADFVKAKRESESPKLNRPSHLIYMEPSLQDIEDFYHEFMVGQPFLSCDIETRSLQITEVGYSLADGSRAIVIPFWDREKPGGNYWDTLEEELQAWAWVRRFNTEFCTIGQNFAYDMKYFWQTVGIPCPRFLDDTMLMHHTLQPELEKGLGFLASVYTNEPSWKFMRTDHATIKKED